MNRIIKITGDYPQLPIPDNALNGDGYPKNWPKFATAVKDWAGWHCENCGHVHDPAAGYTLTVHHLDGIKTNCDWRNLVALCQRCHLHIQAVYFPGQLVMFEAPAWMSVRRLA